VDHIHRPRPFWNERMGEMNLRYLVNEFYHRKARTTVAALGLAVGSCLMVVINAPAYRQASQAPPERFRGGRHRSTFRRCAPRNQRGRFFLRLAGVRQVSTALLMWVFDARLMAIECHFCRYLHGKLVFYAIG
jgi:hypothetical protein